MGHLKENVDTNIKENYNSSGGILGGKLFKFKKSTGVVRKFGDSIRNPFTSLINLETDQQSI